jgi:hypothetical protein
LEAIYVNIKEGVIVRHKEAEYTARIVKVFKNGRIDMEVLTPGDESKGGFSAAGWRNWYEQGGSNFIIQFRNRPKFEEYYEEVPADAV